MIFLSFHCLSYYLLLCYFCSFSDGCRICTAMMLSHGTCADQSIKVSCAFCVDQPAT